MKPLTQPQIFGLILLIDSMKISGERFPEEAATIDNFTKELKARIRKLGAKK